jgi:tight adherence protein C
MIWGPAALLLAAVAAGAAVVDLAAEPRRTPTAPRERSLSGAVVALLGRLGRRLGVLAAPGDMPRRLAAAGAPVALRPRDVMAVKTGAALAAAVLATGPAAALPGRLGPVALVMAPAAGFVLPDLWLRRAIRRRGRIMTTELADVLDLLRVCVEAGQSPARALGEVGRRHSGMLGGELRLAARHLALGRPRGGTFDALAARCPVAEVAALVGALERTELHGAPLGPALTSLAADARADRARAVREHASRAAPKIQLVVALLLVPAVMVLVAAALAAALGAT